MEQGLDRKDSILIVDDDAVILKFMKIVLEMEGYECETAISSQAALERVQSAPFDIMITDIVMPVMNGLELTYKARDIRPNMSVIVTTGFVDNFSYDKAIEAGASDFIKKPFTEKELIARIKHVKMQQEIRNLTLRDELTGIYNRRGFFALVEYQFNLAKRSKTGMFMLYADLDNLKIINDTLGHQEGDTALTMAADILRKNFRRSDIIARIGGDEFVVFPVGTSADCVEKILERLQKAVEAYNAENNRGYSLSISAGISFYDPERPCTIDDLLTAADGSMYERKMNKTLPGV
jgi:two-component system, cell cycle response regulator